MPATFDPRLCFERVSPYLDAVRGVCRELGEESALLVALGSVETEWGWGSGYRPKGSPDGTGDWTARRGGWLSREGVAVVKDLKSLPLGWAAPRKRLEDGTVVILPGPYAIPVDGLGWGRGLLQMDHLGALRHLYRPAPWPVDLQVRAACLHLAESRRWLSRFELLPLFERAWIAAYNAGPSVAGPLQRGEDPDRVTANGRYGAMVQERAAAMRAAFPDVFAPPLSPAPVPTPQLVKPGGAT